MALLVSLMGAVLALQGVAVLAQTVAAISPSTRGSKAGGFRLTLTGSNFSADPYTGSNTVYVGPYPCSVIDHLTTDRSITCDTGPGDDGTYNVSVVVDGATTATACCFSYEDSLTPTLRRVYPSAGPPGTNLSLVGIPSSYVHQDCTAAQQDDGSPVDACVRDMFLGDYRCATENQASRAPLDVQSRP
ncbi:hypothetical protein FOA52_009012 [Chlamydomonas sp. UWO 241]|nr:hypothetical protein FOA52_009012 [Chlamydomonas sp. UWO 241]